MLHRVGSATLVALLLLGAPAFAEPAPDGQETPEQKEKRLQYAYDIAIQTGTPGPSTVRLADQATLAVPQGLVFVPTIEANNYLEQLGNGHDDSIIGLVMSRGQRATSFMMVASFNKVGYVRDEDAKTWSADQLLKELRNGLEAGNEVRRSMGQPEFELAGWVEPPKYDGTHRRMVWAASGQKKGVPAPHPTINYNAFALGREGYISLNALTDRELFEAHKRTAKQLLSALEFNQGKRYEDFNATTDKTAAFGLARLVTGEGLGLLALLVIFVLKFYKLIGLGILALLGFAVSRLFRKKQAASPAPLPAAEATVAAAAVEEKAPEGR